MWDAEDLTQETLTRVFARAADSHQQVERVLRAETAGGRVARLRWYYFCPETLTEVARRLGLPVRPHGYRL